MLLKNKLPFWIALNSYVEAIVSGVPPLSLSKAKNKPVKELKAFGGTEQGLPSEYQLYTEVEAGGVTYTYSSQNLTQIPCMRIADNVFGLYNLITQTFTGDATFTSNGTPITAASPQYDLPIICNNGVLKVNKNLITGSLTQGIYSNGVLDPTVSTWVAYDTFIPVESGKTYTLKATPSVSGKTIEQNVMKYKDGVYIGYTTLANVPYTFTPDDTYNQVKLQFAYQPRENITPSNITNVQLYQNGSIYTDGTVETINIHTKNLYNSATRTDHYYLNDLGAEVEVPNTDVFVSDKITVFPSTTYTLSLTKPASGIFIRIVEYKADGTFAYLPVRDTASTGGNKVYTFTTTAATDYVKFQADMTSTNVQLEKGNQATTYVPYFNGGTATAEMLLKVGTYQDVQSIIDGVVTRKVGVKVLDGTENWAVAHAATYTYTINVSGAAGQSSWSVLGGLCSHLAWYVSNTTPSYVNVNPNTLWFNASADLRVKTNSTFATLADWTQYLAAQYAAGTPVIIVYPLATATTETVTGQPMSTTDGDNIAEITQASMDGLELSVKYIKGA